MNNSLKNMEKRWRQEAKEGKEYLEAELENSNYTDVDIHDVDYKFSAFEFFEVKDAYTRAEDEDDFNEILGRTTGGFELNLASFKFEGKIGDYYGEMEAYLNIQGEDSENAETYWTINTDVASLDREKHPNTVKAVNAIEDTLESRNVGSKRVTQHDTEYDWGPAKRALNP